MAIHRDLADAELHEPKHMQTLTSGASDIGKVIVSKGDGTSEARLLTASETGALKSADAWVIVNSLSDLPTPVSNEITLLADTCYIVTTALLDIGGNYLTLPDNCSVVSLGQVVTKIQNSHPTRLFKTEGSHAIESLRVEVVAGAYVFDHDDTAKGSAAFCNYNDLFIIPATPFPGKIGRWTSPHGTSLVSLESVYTAGVMGDGIEFLGSFGLLTINDGSLVVGFVGDCVDLGTATFGGITIQGTAITVAAAGATGINGAANNANLTAGSIGKVINCFITNPGVGTVLSGIVETDTQWRFFNSTLTQDTRPDSLVSMTGNVTVTTISGGDGDAGNPKKVAGTWVDSGKSQFLFDASGRATFDGDIDTTMPIDISVSAQSASGSPDAKFYIAINGTAIAAATVFMELNTDLVSGHVIWQHTFTKGDYVELFVSNESNTTNITVDTAVIRVN